MKRAQHHIRRFPWYAQIDIRQFFPSIHHETLLGLIQAKLKNAPLRQLIWRIVRAHQHQPGYGLPIGALTSQHFANYYLGTADRFLLGCPEVRGVVRYMDNTTFWCSSKRDALGMVHAVREFLHKELRLQIHTAVQVNRSERGATMCGFRIHQHSIRLTARRRKLYMACRKKWERQFAAGRISAQQLQRGYAATVGMLLHCDSAAWRRAELARTPSLATCEQA